MPRSELRSCKFCNGPIFFDDTIAKGRPLETFNGEIKLHSCKKIPTPAAPQTSNAMVQLVADVQYLKEQVKKLTIAYEQLTKKPL